MGSRSFNANFLAHYNISGFFREPVKGGQKNVNFVVIDGVEQVMKLFDGGYDERFKREMEIYEKYKEIDGIPKIFAIDEYEGEIVVFEEYVAGDTLEVCAGAYVNKMDLVKELLHGLFNIMKPVWKDNFVHRDIKPANIIIRDNGTPVLLDFGIARQLNDDSITVTGAQPGSYKWASPEQYNGKKEMISYRTDFFSLGVLSYFLFHGKLPFGSTIEEIANRFQNNSEAFDVEEDCPLKQFYIESMKFNPAHRPRIIEDLIKLI
jgi:serine/threonine-protein kinase